MAFSYTVTSNTVFGNKRIVFGSFTNGVSDTGGEVATGLKTVDFFIPIGSSLPLTAQINETFPLSSGNVTIVTDPDLDGYWMAIGDGLV